MEETSQTMKLKPAPKAVAVGKLSPAAAAKIRAKANQMLSK